MPQKFSQMNSTDEQGFIIEGYTKLNLNEFEFEFWCLMPLSAIFQQYHGDQF